MNAHRKAARQTILGGLWIAVLSSIVGCVPAEPLPTETPEAPRSNGLPVTFGYETADGGRLSSLELRGRFTVIAFVATYDLASQAQLKVLGHVLRDHSPRVNVAAIDLDPVENKPLVKAFAAKLQAPFPIAIADARTVEGHGPFEGLHNVPSIVILDRDGREVFRHAGAMDERPLRKELERAGAHR